MIDALAGVFQRYSADFLSWWLPMQIQTGVFILIVLLIDTLLRKASPRLRYALWMTAFIKALLPPVFSLPVQDSTVIQVISLATIEVTPAMRQSVVGNVGIDTLMFICAVLASSIFAVAAIKRAVSLRRMLANARPFERNDIPHFPPVYICHSIHTPLTVGVFKARIIITPEIATASPSTLLAVLHHEAAHLRRHDTLFVVLQTVLQIAYALNPLVWLLNMRMFRYREQICDAEAMRTTGMTAQQYGHLLLHFVEAPPSMVFQTAAGFFETRRGFAERIIQLFNISKDHEMKWRQYLLIAALLVAIIPMSWNCESSLKDADVAFPITTEFISDTNWDSDYGKQIDPSQIDGPEIVGGLAELRKRLVYPEEAQTLKLEGTVLVEVSVTEQGTVSALEVKRSVHALLDAAALEAIAGLTFKPAMIKGSVSAATMSIPIKFKLD